MHPVGFIIRTYHNTWSSELQNNTGVCALLYIDLSCPSPPCASPGSWDKLVITLHSVRVLVELTIAAEVGSGHDVVKLSHNVVLRM